MSASGSGRKDKHASRPGKPRPRFTSEHPDPLAQQLPLVSARWLVTCLVGIFGGGLLLVYLTMCFLFWQGQWQILFHPRPSATVAVPHQLPVEVARFGPNAAGQPELTGWYIPAHAADNAAPAATLLYLHDTLAGSLSDAVPELAELHQLGVNLFAFDYRGFGQSANLHPSEKSTTADTEAAWVYLTQTRHLLPSSIYFYGTGLGAALAAQAAAAHPDAAGVILDQPASTALTLLHADPRSRGVPVRLLAHDRFDPAAALGSSTQPKLFLLPARGSKAGSAYAQQARDPKLIVYLPAEDPGAKLTALRRFLDERAAP